jgi:putative endopeptidase
MFFSIVWAAASLAGCGGSGSTSKAGAPAASPASSPSSPVAPAGAATGRGGIDTAGMDRAIAPGDDFFRYANGTWFKTKEIPADRSYDGATYALYEKTQEQTRQLIEAIDRNSSGDDRQVKDYYDTFLDEAAIEAKGLAPLQPLLANVASIQDRRALATYVCGDLRADVDALNATNFHTDRLFGLWFAADLDEPTRYAPFLMQGGLGMPDRDYYLDASAGMEKTRASYLAHIETMLTLAKIPDAKGKAARVFALERKIAGVHATRTESVDVKRANNPWAREEFSKRAPGLDWAECFHAAGLAHVPRVIVWHPKAVRGTAALFGSEPVETWRDFLTFHVIDRNAIYLPKAFVDQRFAFYGKVLTGTQEQRARWKRALDETNDALGDAVGKLYVRRFFPEQAKQQLQVMVKNITHAFERRIDNLAWMSPATKAAAKAKVSTLVVGVGYPDKWRSYTGLGIVRGEALMNRWRAEEFAYDRERGKLDQPVARDEWMMTPQTVNAVNLPVLNAMNFPAAFLQPPFFDPAAPLATNYGAIGAVIGHEISHSFDDQGSQFDASGRFRNWWTKEDVDHFKTASAKLVAQYNTYRPLPDLAVNGQLTLSENIADLAGLAAAYDAFHAAAQGQPQSSSSSQLEKSDLSDDQQFFLAWAQTWRTKMREQMLRQIVMTDGHAPDEYRADTVRNLDAWYNAFAVKPGQRLYLAPPDRIRVW